LKRGTHLGSPARGESASLASGAGARVAAVDAVGAGRVDVEVDRRALGNGVRLARRELRLALVGELALAVREVLRVALAARGEASGSPPEEVDGGEEDGDSDDAADRAARGCAGRGPAAAALGAARARVLADALGARRAEAAGLDAALAGGTGRARVDRVGAGEAVGRHSGRRGDEGEARRGGGEVGEEGELEGRWAWDETGSVHWRGTEQHR